MLSLAMAAVLSLPLAASAQGGRASHGGLFGSKASSTNNAFLDASGNRSGTSSLSAGNQAFGAADAGGLSNEPFGVVPVGGGLLLLVGAGLGYATLKNRRRD